MITSVITTIQPPTPQMIRLNEVVDTLIVMGDRKGPQSYLEGARFGTVEAQRNMPFSLAKALPENSYSRKNLGYLHAIRNNAPFIYETDDDNRINDDWKPRTPDAVVNVINHTKWCNVYKWFSDRNVWPRGLPLSEIQSKGTNHCRRVVVAPIQQCLVDGDPDVDAVWRLTHPGERIEFQNNPSIALSAGTWCPFNSQNTHWFPAAYPLMYLPSTCNFRVTDIWRGLVAQRCLWEEGHRIVFHAPDAFQKRNEHDLSKDLQGDLCGLESNYRIQEVLDSLKLESNTKTNIRTCYRALIHEKIFPEKELSLLDLWLDDLS